MPSLWIGTSLGSVLTVAITLPDPENRKTSPVVVTILGKSPTINKKYTLNSSFFFSSLGGPGGPYFRLKGSIMCLGFLDNTGALIPNSYEVWRDDKQRDSPYLPLGTD